MVAQGSLAWGNAPCAALSSLRILAVTPGAGEATLCDMTERDPAIGRRMRARYDVLRKAGPGDDIDALIEARIAELEKDPFDYVFSQNAAAAPPPSEWEPGLALELRRLFKAPLARHRLLTVPVRLRWVNGHACGAVAAGTHGERGSAQPAELGGPAPASP